MNRQRALAAMGVALVTFVASASISACSSSDDSTPTPPTTPVDAATTDTGNTPSDAGPKDAAPAADVTTSTSPITWKDDGAQNNAEGTAESLGAGGGIIGFALNVADTTLGNAISINITTTAPADWKPGTFACPTPAAMGYVHTPNGGVTYKQKTCSITITQTGAVGGPNLQGTFEATFDVSSGGTKTISNGTFDVAYK